MASASHPAGGLEAGAGRRGRGGVGGAAPPPDQESSRQGPNTLASGSGTRTQPSFQTACVQ